MDIQKKTETEYFSDDSKIRINKFLSDAGFCSRREADRLIAAGRVSVCGRNAVLGEKVNVHESVCVDGVEVTYNENLVLIAFNKPMGIECTADRNNPDNIIDFVNYKERIYPVGRLDKNSHGLILLTNDGVMGNKILKASNFHEKEYIVTVNKEVDEIFLHGMAEGVPLKEMMTRPCTVVKEGGKKFRIIITQGLNRQIRRMCEYFGYKVTDLKRVRVVNIELGSLKTGKYRQVTGDELLTLRNIIEKEENIKHGERHPY